MSTDSRMSSFNEAIGEWLHDARIEAGVSVEDAADRLGAEPDHVREVEAGKVSLSGQDFYALIAAYQIPVAAVNSFLEAFGLQVAAPTA